MQSPHQRKQVDPKRFKKRSDVIRQQEAASADKLLVKGDREPTSTGYKVPGFAGEFETYFEVMLPKTSTNLVQHPGKSRVYRVVGGGGLILKQETVGEGEEEQTNSSTAQLGPGDEVVVGPKTVYRLMAANLGIELFVVQEKKYEARLKTVAETEVTADVPQELLVAPSEEEILRGTRVAQGSFERRGSKAVMQQQVKKIGKVVQQNQEKKHEEMPAAAGTSLNARPTMGNFTE